MRGGHLDGLRGRITELSGVRIRAHALEVPLRRHHFAGAGRHLDLCGEGDGFARRDLGALAAVHLEMDHGLDALAFCSRRRHVHLAVLHPVFAGGRRDDALLDPCAQLA